MVPPRLKVEILVSWLWVKRCVFAGIKKLGWYSVGRVRVSLVLVLNRFSLFLPPAYSYRLSPQDMWESCQLAFAILLTCQTKPIPG